MGLFEKILGSVVGGRVVVVGGRPGMGKTTFLIRLLRDILESNGKETIFISLERSKEDLEQKISQILDVESLTSGMPAIYSPPTISPEELVSMIETSQKNGLAVQYLFIDYFGLINARNSGPFDNLDDERERIISDLHEISRKYNLAIVIAMNIKRGGEHEASYRPQPSDLPLVKNVDKVDDLILIYRSRYYDKSTSDEIEVTHYAKGSQAKWVGSDDLERYSS